MVVRPEGEQDLASARDRYEQKCAGLGEPPDGVMVNSEADAVRN